MYRVPSALEPPVTIWRYAIVYSALYVLGNAVLLCKKAVAIDSQCRGSGAAFPGGCPEHSDAANRQLAFFGLGGLVLMLGLLWLMSARGLPRRTRSLMLIGYGLCILFGPLILFVPPPPR
jgi:hypothetical protein